MSSFKDEKFIKAPFTYQEWLDCLSLLKSNSSCSAAVYDALISGTFGGTEATLAAFQRQLVVAINAMLNRSMKRFVRKMNESIIFNELIQLDLIFIRLKKDVHLALFFESLRFLPDAFRNELSDSVRKQMTDFWNGMVSFLYEQSLEHSNSDLEDALFLIKRKRIFD